MPSISLGEIFIICLAVMIFVKPEELPKFLRTIGRYYGQFMAYTQKIKDYGRDTYHEISSLDQPDLTGRKPGAPGIGGDTAGASGAPRTSQPTAYNYSMPLDQIDLPDPPPPRTPPPAAPTESAASDAPPTGGNR